MTFEFPAQRASNAEYVSIWWRHHVSPISDYCGRGLGTNLIHISHQAAWSAGFLDSTTRMTTKDARIFDKAGKEMIGEIPYSIYSRGKGRLSDYLTFHTESLSHQDEHDRRKFAIDNKRNKPVLDVLTPETEIPPWVFTDVVVKSEKVRIPGYAEPCVIRAGYKKDVYAIETMLRHAADKGNGFALDEFNPDGFFNRKFLRECHNLVLCSPDGDVLGAALFGPSAICQSITTPVLHFYIVVSKEGKNRGVGMHLLDAVIEFASKNSYLAVFGDAFDMDVRATQFLIRNGFKKTCSLPNCAYVKDVGLAAASLYTKDVLSLYRDCMKNIHETWQHFVWLHRWLCARLVTPVRQQWSYHSVAFSHWYVSECSHRDL